MEIPGRRTVAKGTLELEGFKPGMLELSGLVLGSPVTAGARAYRRQGVALLPRPSKRFARGETVAVFLEIYGLREDIRRQSRHWRERVAVTRKDNGSSGVSNQSCKLRPAMGS